MGTLLFNATGFIASTQKDISMGGKNPLNFNVCILYYIICVSSCCHYAALYFQALIKSVLDKNQMNCMSLIESWCL